MLFDYNRSFPCLVVLLLCLAGAAPGAAAQDLTPRFGIGFNTLLSTADGLGMGFRGRASAPVNADLSMAVDMGFTGFVLRGRRDATYIFDPQVSAIINLPTRRNQLMYVLFGLGAYVPVGEGNDGQNGPTLHLGIGWVRALNESSFYYELDPALVIGEESVDLAFPIRIGLIF